MASNSQRSSLADIDHYHYSTSHSSLSSLSNDSIVLATTAPSTATTTAPASTTTSHVRKQTSLANIDVPSFSNFRSRVSSIPIASPSPAARRPLPHPTPATRPASLAEIGSPRLAHPNWRPQSLASPALQQQVQTPSAQSALSSVRNISPIDEDFTPRPPKRTSSALFDYPIPPPSRQRNGSIASEAAGSDVSQSSYGDSRRSSIPIHARYSQEHSLSHAPKLSTSSIDPGSFYSPAQRLSTVSMNSMTEPLSMNVELNGVRRTLTDESLSPSESLEDRRPKSPGVSKLGNLFGWKSTPRSDAESPTTAFSDRSPSPLPSPGLRKPKSMDAFSEGSRLTPSGLDVRKANALPSPAPTEYFESPGTPILIGGGEENAHVKDLERELTQVSSELAESIRREMDLEDEIERFKLDAPNLPVSDMARRGSDYFSDSGASSTRFPITDIDAKLNELEQKLRKSDQEKAQMKIDTASRLQTELGRRRDLEQMVQKMEKQLQRHFDEDEERGDIEGRVEELASTLEDTRRLLSQERQAKGSFEDLYSASREELERNRNEHENLRDEVVPQLKARIDGLEQEATDTQALVYENTRMQQELSTLKSKVHGRFGSIVEEHDDVGGSSKKSLSRSGSLAKSQSRRGVSLSRSMSVVDRTDGARQRSGSTGENASVENAKEIVDQRDALHKALQLLLIRSDKQQREHVRAIKKLTSAKNRAEVLSPGRSVYHKEVSLLKEEVATLRKRTEDALEQKWQYEKGLSGIKMDLDRAELETRGLRIILQEHDILGSEQANTGGSADDKLQQSISTAEEERDQARRVAEEYRQRARSVQDDSSDELMNSANRMDELADHLETQVQSNIELRARLAEAVTKGEREQKESNGKIGEMQKRLASMEDSVLAAQQHSEATLGSHEAEVRRLEEASSPSLQRLRISIPFSDTGKKPSSSAHLAPAPSTLPLRSPKLLSKKLSDSSLLEVSKTQMLERKVRELEGLLREAEQDMQDVVQRVNKSQLEVAELQTERDAALTQMRKLQALVVREREKAEELMMR